MNVQIYPIGSVFQCGERKVMNIGFVFYRNQEKLKLAYQVCAWPQGCTSRENVQLLPVEEAVLYQETKQTDISLKMKKYLEVIAQLAREKPAAEVEDYIKRSQNAIKIGEVVL